MTELQSSAEVMEMTASKENLADFYTEDQLAERRGVAIKTLRNIFSMGDFPPYLGRGSRKRFPKKEADQWLASQMTLPRKKSWR